MKKPAVVLLHVGYWILYIILVCFFIQLVPNTRDHFIKVLLFSQVTVFAFIPGVICFYLFYAVLFPRFLSRKKFLALSLSVLLAAVLCSILTLLLISVLFNVKWFSLSGDAITGMIIFISLLGLVHGVIALVMRGFITWFGDIKLKEELARKNYEVELALVKSQLNPHFLFNTINNIDVLIEKNPATASAYLNKLSGIMRFMLYETKPELIALSKELEYIGQYIDLQRIRSSNHEYISYDVRGNANNKMIAPILFIPFIENAFKHAEHYKKENAVSIKFMIGKDSIDFYCENKFSSIKPGDHNHGGLGNELIRKRLNLLYPGRHHLEMTTKDDTYIVKLILRADEH